MRTRWAGLVAGSLLAMLPAGMAEACHGCGRTPCVVPAPQPAYRCVTEMVPYTVMKCRTRTDWVPVTRTVMARVPHTTMVPKQVMRRRPVFDTTYVTRTRMVRRREYDTQWITRTYTACRPVPTERQVTSYCLQPTGSWTEAVPSSCGGCGHCGSCSVNYVTKTAYAPVPVTRTVTDITYVPEVRTKQVPLTSCRTWCEPVTETVPVRHCRWVCEWETIEVPHTTWTCEPKEVTRMVPVRTPEVVPVTCYRPVKRWVPCEPAYAGPAYDPNPAYTSAQGPTPAGQGGTAAPQG